MGNCCNRHLLIELSNKTRVYYQCPEKIKIQSKVIKITLEADVYKLEPHKNNLIETSGVHRYSDQEGVLALLKGEEGIKTRESKIKQAFEQILYLAADTNKNIVFDQPKVNYENTKKLFKDLIYAIFKYDDINKNKKLKHIYLPWSELTPEQMRQIYEKERQSLISLLD